jgi:gentisate 1,2-dioxygenase
MGATTRTTADEKAEARRVFYARIGEQHLAPLWERLSGLVTRSPEPAAKPVHWKYASLRPDLIAAGLLLTAEEAERRVLILENPGLPGQSKITGSLYGGLQLLMPGERAHAHRHTASALRLFLEGNGAYTAVNGERTIMERGDFVLTPAWMWHEHGNEGFDPVIWLDGLDVPIVNLFDTSFSEAHQEGGERPEVRPARDSEVRYSGTLLPEGGKPETLASPLLNYRYERARETLAALDKSRPIDPYHAVKLRYVNPLTGGPVLPTMSAAIQLIARGFETAPYRSTEGTVFVVVEGKGCSKVGDLSFEWSESDIFVAPSWARQQHRAETESVIFSFSDRVAQEKLGIWREQRL